ncbi:bifunctional methylenetetrahydrofolate dehydrogenase/methenyltetrahydrofolate cyclohydrolase FolD [Buchnera aphidicola]|uniref:Bifunctional protein FolD n=1 Tax=Buchnera aphidicola (Anoecia oenotherae) TaxID=1241833 RepID=A0A4D6XQ25_9GAMM|nr:bifunctional methylenetetrahydrofolate dehydrogenase/methenyltetrahydrofolate cyclohydrolase FolD [Buchnera aphidicola]QCI19492.1 bifunctional methylenetetrahydrofolate dehydrogenase/methenyltetrahydrofolate cyclohydrolase FolD [Buchnera aphidicola (Anoecia oenotherae)]
MKLIEKIMDGVKVSNFFKEKLKKRLLYYKNKGNRPPYLAVILIGKNPASLIYVQHKKLACKNIGIKFIFFHFSKNVSEISLLKQINHLNNDKKIDAILIQLPLPNHINTANIFNSISPYKDVDGFHPYNIGSLCQKNPTIIPCTPRGIITLMKFYNVPTYGLNAVIVGASNIVGRPMNLALLLHGCTTTVTHRFTKNLKEHTQKAELLIVAIGKAEFIDSSWIKEKSIIIDVGINKQHDGGIIGDVKFKSVIDKASLITPVPGGIGPMTILSLLQNTIDIYEKNIKKIY